MDRHTVAAASPPSTRDVRRDATVDVVIVSADMHDMTRTCVDALVDPLLARITLVDNASGAERALVAELFGERTDVVRLEHPEGFAAANNRGLLRGHAPYVLFLNSDIVSVRKSIGQLVRALEEDPGAVAAGGRLVDPDTLVTQPAYRPRSFPTLANFLLILLGIEEHWPNNPITRRYHGAQIDERSVQAVAQPAAAALLVRRAEIEAVGGFDERFWFWFEDSDLLLRLSSRGRVLYVPCAVFRHLGGGTFRNWSKSERIRSIHHGILHYGDAHLSRVQRFTLGILAMAISLPRVALFRRSRPSEAEAWRAVAIGAFALIAGRRPPVIAPGPTAS